MSATDSVSTLTEPLRISPAPGCVPQVVASVCCDLGGSVRDWRELLSTLVRSGYPDVCRWDRSEESWQMTYRITHPPILLLKSKPLELDFHRRSSKRDAVREIRIYPAGVVVFRYILPLDDGASVADLYSLREKFQFHRRKGYISHLKEFYGEANAARLNDLEEPPSSGGIEIVPTVLELRDVCAKALDARPEICPAQSVRWALCMSRPPDAIGLQEDLAQLAAAKDLACPIDADGDLPRHEYGDFRLRKWPGLVLASWEGFDVYVAADSADVCEIAVDSFELSHQFAFLCRAWIEILDGMQSADISGEELRVAEVRSLEKRMLEVSMLERAISASMVEIDSTEVMLVDSLRLELAADYAARFKVGPLKRMVFERLDALNRHTGFVQGVLDRNFQEVVHNQGKRLQLLFAAAVAAQISAVVLAVAATPRGARLWWAIAITALTILVWGAFVFLARRVMERREHRPLQADAAAAVSVLPGKARKL